MACVEVLSWPFLEAPAVRCIVLIDKNSPVRSKLPSLTTTEQKVQLFCIRTQQGPQES